MTISNAPSARAPAQVTGSRRLWPLPTRTASAAAVLAAVLVILLLARIARTSPFVDTEAYAAAAQAVRHGESPYQRALAWRDAGYTYHLPGAVPPVAGMPYLYPPPLALAFVPLSFLPLRLLNLLWLGLSLACLLAAVALLLRLLSPDRQQHQLPLVLIATAVCAFFQPVRATLTAGQVDTVLLLFIVLALAAWNAGHQGRAGVWLALAASVKPFLGFLVLALLWKRAYRAALTTCLLWTGLVLASILVLGTTTAVDFLAVARYFTSATAIVSPHNQSPTAFALRLFAVNPFTQPVLHAPVLALAVRMLLLVGTASALALVIRRSAATDAPTTVVEFSCFVAAMLVLSPVSEDIHLTYLVVPLLAGLAVLSSSLRTRAWPLICAVLGVYVYLSAPKIHSLKMANYAFYQAPVQMPQLLLTGLHSYAIVVLTAVMLLILRHHYRRDAPTKGLSGAPLHTEGRFT
jgi:hypothetical protein